MRESFRVSLDDIQKRVKKNIPEKKKKKETRNKRQNKVSFPQVLAGICFAGHALMITL